MQENHKMKYQGNNSSLSQLQAHTHFFYTWINIWGGTEEFLGCLEMCHLITWKCVWKSLITLSLFCFGSQSAHSGKNSKKREWKSLARKFKHFFFACQLFKKKVHLPVKHLYRNRQIELQGHAQGFTTPF